MSWTRKTFLLCFVFSRCNQMVMLMGSVADRVKSATAASHPAASPFIMVGA